MNKDECRHCIQYRWTFVSHPNGSLPAETKTYCAINDPEQSFPFLCSRYVSNTEMLARSLGLNEPGR